MAKSPATTPVKSNAPTTKGPANSAAPGNKPEGAPTENKKEKVKRVAYRGEDAPLLEAIPADFTGRTHLPLKKSDFANEWVFFEFKAKQADAAGIRFRKQAEESKTLGSSADRQKKKKLLNMMKRMADLKKELEADGVDTTALEASMEEDGSTEVQS